MPRAGAINLRHEILIRLEQISVLLLLPVFFLVSGLQVDLRGLTRQQVLLMLLILAAAIAGKYIGAYAGARARGVRPWQARSLGILMNTRGLTELVILNVGLGLGLIGEHLFSMLVVMALVTTMMTGPLLRRAYPERRVARDIAEAERAALNLEAVRVRVLVVAVGAQATSRRFDLAVDVIADEHPAEVVLSRIEPFTSTRLEVGSGLSEELSAMTESMTSLEALVERGAREGVAVNVLTRFSGDVVADLLAQVEALDPDVVVVGQGDEVTDAVMAEASCRVLVVADSWLREPSPSLVEVAWGGMADDDAAVVLAVRIASFKMVPLVVEAADGVSKRRVASLVQRLGNSGVQIFDGRAGTEPRWRVGSVSRSEVDIGVRVEPDPEPVDWTTVQPAQPRHDAIGPSGP
jgi:hypothetical protein